MSLHWISRCVAFLVCFTALCPAGSKAQPKERLSFEQIFKNADPLITKPLPAITKWVDGHRYLESRKETGLDRPLLTIVDAATGKETAAPDIHRYAEQLGKDIDPSSFVAASDDETRYLYSRQNDLFLFDTTNRVLRRLTTSDAQEENPTFSPDGKYLAFTRKNDLYSLRLSDGVEIRHTTDGSDVVYNGRASWLYYEEILGRASRYRAFSWSPDSKHIGFYRFDDSPVPEFVLVAAGGVHGKVERARYPKPGDPSPEVRIGIVPAAGGTTVWAAFNEKQDQYFGLPFWTPDGQRLLIQWMNRGQDSLIVYSVAPSSGAKQMLLVEHQPSWVDWFESVEFLENRAGFIVLSDRSGWAHLYLYGMDGKLKRQLTDGPWAVTRVQTIDPASGTVFFTATREASTRTDLYSIRLDGTDFQRLTFGEFNHTVRVAPKGAYFITTYSSVHQPPRMALLNGKGKLIRDLGDSRSEHFDRYELALPEMITIPTADGYALPAVLTMPLDFDPEKKYPVLFSVYGGPQAATVSDGWKPLTAQWLAREGVLQVSVDHRGSGHFGKAGAALMHRRLGYWEMHDLAEAVRWLRLKPYVDSTRVAIEGGSYGGYVTSLALTAGADWFTHGIAEFSVTDWRLYDSHYTERYMDSPAENPEGYRQASTLTHAGKYRGQLRLVHGTMDDNVHMQNTIQLIDTLQDLNRDFELMLYPGGRHGWGGPKAVHLRTENYRFYYRHLLRKEFPEELFKTLDVASMRRRR